MKITELLQSLSDGQVQYVLVGGLAVIPEHLMLSRLSQSEQMREFFIQMWLQNPALAKQGGSKVQDLLRPHPAPPTPALPKPFADLKSAGQALSATHTLDCGSFVTVAAGAGHVGRECLR